MEDIFIATYAKVKLKHTTTTNYSYKHIQKRKF